MNTTNKNYISRSNSSWGKCVHAEGGHKCAVPGCKNTLPLEAHHIGGKSANAMRFLVELGILLCTQHHKFAEMAPHKNKGKFLIWLEYQYPDKYWLYMKLKNVIVSDRDMDFKAICHNLEEARIVSDRIAIISKGRIVQTDTLGNLIDNPKTDIVKKILRLTDKN